MNTSISFAHPHRIYAPKEKIEKLGIEIGTPIELSIDIDEEFVDEISAERDDFPEFLEPIFESLEIGDVPEQEHQVREELLGAIEQSEEIDSATVTGEIRPRSEFDAKKEDHALFYAIYNRASQLPDNLQSEFKQFINNSDQQMHLRDSALQLDSKRKIEEYLNKINQFNQDRLDDGLIVGCGLFELMMLHSRSDQVRTPHFSIAFSAFCAILDGSFHEVDEIKRFNGTIREPESVYFCTYNHVLNNDQNKELKSTLAKQTYFLPNRNYLFRHHLIGQHGPVRTDLLDDEVDLLKVSEEDIEFTAISTGHIHSSEKITVDMIKDILNKTLDDEYVDFDKEHSVWEITKFDSNISLESVDDFIIYEIQHPVEAEEQTPEWQFIETFLEELSTEFGISASSHPVYNTAPEISEKNVWVFDTNELYNQTGEKSPTHISDFIIKNYQIYDKEIKIPCEVLFEINRHKEADQKTSRASQVGIENLEILKILSQHGFFELDIEPFPENNLVTEKGSIDLQILSSISKDGVLITGDQRLIEIGELSDMPVYDVTELRGPTNQDEFQNEIWEELQNELKQGPVSRSSIKDIIQEKYSKNSDMDQDDLSDVDVDRFIGGWLSDDKIVDTIEDDNIVYYDTEVIEVIPTFEILTNIKQNVEQKDGESYINNAFLETIRQSIGGLQTHQRPKIHFHIPNQYVHTAQEVGQINSIYQATMCINISFESRKIRDDSGTMSLEKVAVEAARSHDATLIVGENQSDIYKIGNLLGVDISKVNI